MAQHAIFEVLGLAPDSNLDQIERGFMTHVIAHMQAASENYDDAVVQKEERYLRLIYPLFFDYSIFWIKEQLEKNNREKSHPDAFSLKKEARTVLATLQNDIIAFAVCYMHITRLMTLVRDEIRSNNMKAIAYAGPGGEGKKVRWTSETGVMLGRNKKRKSEIDQLTKQYKAAREILTTIEPLQGVFEEGINAFSREDAEKILRSYRAALRVADFERAAKVLATIGTQPGKASPDRRAAIQKAGQEILAFYKRHVDILSGDEKKLFLSASEVKIVLDSNAMETRKIRAFMVKYNLPYMEYKLEELARLRDRLMVIGSPEGLMTLYRKLIIGMASPLRSLEELRGYEAEVLSRIKYLQTSQFQDVPKIFQAAVQTVDEFRVARNEYETDMDILRDEGHLSDLNGDFTADAAGA